MRMNPFVNALAAALYIVLIVFTIDAFASFVVPKETILIPITMLSLFVLSTACMGFLFVYKPLQLLLDNQKQEALEYFMKTVGSFVVFAVACAAALLLITPR